MKSVAVSRLHGTMCVPRDSLAYALFGESETYASITSSFFKDVSRVNLELTASRYPALAVVCLWPILAYSFLGESADATHASVAGYMGRAYR